MAEPTLFPKIRTEIMLKGMQEPAHLWRDSEDSLNILDNPLVSLS